jgi:hypothetical protein
MNYAVNQLFIRIGNKRRKVLILPILKHHRRKAHTEIVGFSLVAVCQMRDGAIHPGFPMEVRTSGIFTF